MTPEVLQIVETLSSLGSTAILLFLYVRQDERLRRLEDKYLSLIDLLVNDAIKEQLVK